MESGTAIIDCRRGQYTIPFAEGHGEVPWTGNALLESVIEGIIMVGTGTGEGPLLLTVEIHEQEPPLGLEGWEEVVEVGRVTSGGRIAVCELMEAPREDLLGLSLGPGASFRVRCHARGRDAAAARDRLSPDEEPLEEHLIQMWPAPEAPDVCHRLTDEVGRIMRERIRGTGDKAPPP